MEVWSDVNCPWCYIGKRRFEKALTGFEHRDDVEVSWRSYQLDPGLPQHFPDTELDYLCRFKGMSPAQVRSMFDHVTQVAAAEGLTYDFHAVRVANSFDAHRLVHLAGSSGRAGQVKEALLSAHFERGQDIADREVLVGIAADAGIDEDDARAMLGSERFAAEVRADIECAREIGITGVPFFVIDAKFAISGAQPAERFRRALTQAWQQAHPRALVPAGNDAQACGPDGCS